MEKDNTELDSLKKTWNKLAPDKELDEIQFKEMLRNKTRTLLDIIERNIKIGLLILLFLLLLFIIDDFIISPTIAGKFGKIAQMPVWAQLITIFSNTFILTTFVYFVLSYLQIRKRSNLNKPIRLRIKEIISTLKIYKGLFYLATFTFLFSISSLFIAGLYEGISIQARQMGVSISEINTETLVVPALIGIGILLLLMVGLFIFLKWGFKKLYGDYIIKLNTILSELNSIEE